MAVHTEPGLRAGWEPDAPAEDTLLRRYLLNAAASNAAPVATLGGRVLQRDDVVAADLGRPAGFVLNAAVLLRPLDGAAGEELLDALEGFYDGRGTGTVSLVSAWPTPDLRARGWRLEGHPPLLIRPPAGPPAVAVPEPLDIVEASDGEHVEDWCRVAVEGFPFPELQPYRPGSLLDERVLADGRLRLWIGYEAGRPVCIGALFVEHGLGHFFLAVTLPQARGRGYYRAMAARRIAAAPDVPLAALFSDLSRPVVERHFAFWPVTRFTLWTRARPRRA